MLTGTYAFGAIMTALYRRQPTGEGQLIDVSMLESMLSLTLSEIQLAQFAVAPPGRAGLWPDRHQGRLYQPVDRQREDFQNLAIASRPPAIGSPTRGLPQYPDRRANWGELIDELELWSKERTTSEVQALFDRHGVPSSPYRTVSEAMADPQLAHRGAFATVHDGGGTFTTLNPPFRFSAMRAEAAPHAAALGEDGEALLAELGYTAGRDQGTDETGCTSGSRVTIAAPPAVNLTRLTVPASSGEPE